MLQPPENSQTPAFLYMGLKYIELAQNKKHLFRLLCMSGIMGELNSFQDMAKNIPVAIDPEVFVKTWIFAHGIATIVSTNVSNITQDEIKQLLIEACTSFSRER